MDRSTAVWQPSFCRHLFGVLLVFVLIAASNVAVSASLRVAPLKVELDANHTAQQLEVLNQGAADVVVDVHVAAWAQVDGVDQLEATTELVAVPPVVRIPAGKKQVLRVGLTNPHNTQTQVERSYRLVLTEIPQDSGDEGTLRFQLRVLIPVFVAPAADVRPDVVLGLRKDGAQLRLEAANNGNVHAKVAGIILFDAARQVLGREPVVGYVLPGATMSWPLKAVEADGIDTGEAEIYFGSEKRPVMRAIVLP